MAPLAETFDIEARWRPLTDAEQQIAPTLIDDASANVRAQAPGVDDRIADGSLDPMLVAGVVARMVIRVLRNPTGAVSRQRQVDDASMSETYDREAVRAEMYLPDADLSLITPSCGGGAFTIRPAYVDPTTDTWAVT